MNCVATEHTHTNKKKKQRANLLEDLNAVEHHLLLRDEDLLAAVDDEVAALVVGALAEFRQLLVGAVRQHAVLRTQHDRDLDASMTAAKRIQQYERKKKNRQKIECPNLSYEDLRILHFLFHGFAAIIEGNHGLGYIYIQRR